MGRLIRLAAAAGLGVVVLSSGLAVAEPFRDCREDEAATETQIGGHGLLTVYTDDLAHYVGVCGLERGGYVQVNEPGGAINGANPLAEARTGIKAVDKAVNRGRAEVWVQGGQDDDNCAPADENRFGNNTGTEVNRALPTVYTDGGATHVGVCTDRLRVQVNDPAGAVAGSHDLVDIDYTP